RARKHALLAKGDLVHLVIVRFDRVRIAAQLRHALPRAVRHAKAKDGRPCLWIQMYFLSSCTYIPNIRALRSTSLDAKWRHTHTWQLTLWAPRPQMFRRICRPE